MERTRKEQFEVLWNDFVVTLRGRLINISKQRAVSISLANLNLSELLTSWNVVYESRGQWMDEFAKADESRARLVKEILQDIKFEPVDAGRPLGKSLNIIVPVVGATMGFVCAYVMGASKLTQMLSSAVPGVLLIPTMKTIVKQKEESVTQKTIALLMEQLNKYHDSIIPILENE